MIVFFRFLNSQKHYYSHINTTDQYNVIKPVLTVFSCE